MMEANTNATTPVNREFAYAIYISFTVFGVILILSNGLIVVNLLRHAALRQKKEYVLLNGLAFSDLLAGVSSLLAGANRLSLLDLHEEATLIRTDSCLRAPHFAILAFTFNVQSCMLFAITLDRLIAVVKPLKHCTFTVKYAWTMVGVFYAFCGVYTAALMIYVSATGGHRQTGAMCLLNAVDPIFSSIFNFRLLMATLSVVVYVLVYWLYRRYMNRTIEQFPSAMLSNQLRKRQRYLATTVGICAVATFFLYIVPNLPILIATYAHFRTDPWAPLIWVFNCSNAVVNIFIFSVRHADIRQGLRLLFRCRTLPSPAMERLRKESQSSLSATGKAAIYIIETMGFGSAHRSRTLSIAFSERSRCNTA